MFLFFKRIFSQFPNLPKITILSLNFTLQNFLSRIAKRGESFWLARMKVISILSKLIPLTVPTHRPPSTRALTEAKVSSLRWHQRLGHPAPLTLQRLIRGCSPFK